MDYHEMTRITAFHDSQRMTPNDFGDPLTFLNFTVRLTFVGLTEIQYPSSSGERPGAPQTVRQLA